MKKQHSKLPPAVRREDAARASLLEQAILAGELNEARRLQAEMKGPISTRLRAMMQRLQRGEAP